MDSDEVPRNPTSLPPKPRRLPEIPKDQEPYDVTKVPRKPPRQRPRVQRSSTPDMKRRNSGNSNLQHKRSRSLTEFRRLSVTIRDGGENQQVKESLDSGNRESSVVRKASATAILDQTTPTSLNNNPFSLPAYCGEDAIFNRRCTDCHQRIFPEGESFLIAQSLLFHVTCFQCAICTTCVDVTEYCYVTEHEKFYCLRHYHEILEAGKGISDEGFVVNGVGPGVFAAVVGRRRKRKDTVKTLTELQHRRMKLAQVVFHLEAAIKCGKSEEQPFLWKHWFDVTFENMMVAKAVTELAYQHKEFELLEEQEKLQRKLRRLRRERRKGGREENAKDEEEIFLHEILNVIEKRDLLLLELEIERRRDDDETEKLKALFQLQDRSKTIPSGEPKEISEENFSDKVRGQDGQCVIL